MQLLLVKEGELVDREKLWQIGHVVGEIRSFDWFHTLRFLSSKQTQIWMYNAEENCGKDYNQDYGLDFLLDAAFAVLVLPIGSLLIF